MHSTLSPRRALYPRLIISPTPLSGAEDVGLRLPPMPTHNVTIATVFGAERRLCFVACAVAHVGVLLVYMRVRGICLIVMFNAMFFINLIMNLFSESWDDDLFDDYPIDEGNDNEVKNDGEGKFKGPVGRAGKQFSIFFGK